MSTTAAHSSSHLNRKDLKRPDFVLAQLKTLFDRLSKNRRFIWAAAAGALVLVGLLALLSSRSEAKNEKARSAFYLAQTSMLKELKALAEAKAAPATPKKDAKKPAQPIASLESVEFETFDVDAKLPETVKKLREIDTTFGSERAAFEARLELANLYLKHGDVTKAMPWAERALGSAPSRSDKAMVNAVLASAFETQEKWQDALQHYQRAADGEASIKAEMLLSIARCHRSLKDGAKAKAVYDQIVSQFPNTESARQAEALKAELP